MIVHLVLKKLRLYNKPNSFYFPQVKIMNSFEIQKLLDTLQDAIVTKISDYKGLSDFGVGNKTEKKKIQDHFGTLETFVKNCIIMIAIEICELDKCIFLSAHITQIHFLFITDTMGISLS